MGTIAASPAEFGVAYVLIGEDRQAIASLIWPAQGLTPAGATVVLATATPEHVR